MEITQKFNRGLVEEIKEMEEMIEDEKRIDKEDKNNEMTDIDTLGDG